MEYWKLSRECAEDSARFWKVAGYHDGESHTDYTNHFNMKLGKCFIRIRNIEFQKDRKDVSDRIFDAVDGVEQMWLLYSSQDPDPYLEINGERVEDTPKNRARMDALMETNNPSFQNERESDAKGEVFRRLLEKHKGQ